MPKLSEEDIAKELQKAWDEMSMSSQAHASALMRRDQVIRKVMDRSIAEYHEHEVPLPKLEPHEFIYRNPRFNPTDEEETQIRRLHDDVRMYEEIRNQKRAAWRYIEKHKKPMPSGYQEIEANKGDLYLFLYRIVVLSAALLVIWHAL